MSKLDICIVAAVSENGVIGNGNDIPWKIPGEQKRFKELTQGHCVLMGRKTHDSIGILLPDRINIIVTRDPFTKLASDNKPYNESTTKCVVAPTVELGISAAKLLGNGKLFIIGGGEIYKQTMNYANEMVISRVHANVDGDVYFPEIGDDWNLIDLKYVKASTDYSVVTYKRDIEPAICLEDTLDVII